ncbi:SwmB domain-containing protein [Paenibacillus sp. YPG26]|uniref:SwmB domain-containing protein n=1 Tax=Paenibacillus sp. YPG26 TaxID=2878915 RepID=UPI00203FFD28|nr:SwmB domain-containing protein [Paenibacillus sp. YPG26]USB32854.1 S-layer homology domain-containing protein [Paenibacillus sp. YPG26]
MRRRIALWLVLVMGFNVLTAAAVGAAPIQQDPTLIPVVATPANGSKGIDPAKVDLKVQFDRKVKAGTGTITVTKDPAGASTVVGTIPVTPSVVDAYSAIRNIDTSGITYTPGSFYRVSLSGGTFADEAGNTSAAYSYTFKTLTSGSVPPTASTFTPVNNAIVNGTSQTLSVTFSKPITKGKSGNITVKRASDNTTALSLPVTSTQVALSGGDTASFPVTGLTQGERYYVLIDSGAFLDEDDQAFAGITSAQGWVFNVRGTAVQLVSVSPANLTSNVAASSSLKLTFSRPVYPDQGFITIKPSGQAAQSIAMTSSSVTGGGTNTITVTPPTSLLSGTSYTVTVPVGAFTDSDKNQFPSSVDYSWGFTTGAQDTTAPVLQSTQMYNSTTIRLQYNKTLDSTVNLQPSSFQIYVNGESRRISSAYVSGDSVHVVLETGVSLGQNVRISYTGSAGSSIQDIYQNTASAFSLREVANGVDSSLPQTEDGYASGSTVVLAFRDTLKSVSSYATGQFSVSSDGAFRGISSISQSGNRIYLNLSTPIASGEVVKVSYSPGSYPVQDYRGQNIPAFNNMFVRNMNDTKAPVFTKVEGTGNSLVLTYNEALKPNGIPMKSQYSVLVNNAPVYVTAIAVNSNQVTLTLASSFSVSQYVTVSYVPSTDGISDLNGNLAGYLNQERVNNSSLTTGPSIRSATVKGDTVTLVYNGSLRSSSSAIAASQFYVTADQLSKGIQSVVLDGSTLVIKLTSPVTAGQIVDLSYAQGSTLIYDGSNALIASFSRMGLQNITDAAAIHTGLPTYLSLLQSSEFGRAAFMMNSTTSARLTDRSRMGQDISRYTLDNSKMSEAYSYLAASGLERTLGFEVPSTERAAKVAIPLQPLLEAYTRGGNPSFVVRYGDVLYEVPLAKISFVDISRLTGGSTLSSSYLTVQLERISKTSLMGQSSSTGAGVSYVAVEDPVEAYISVMSSTLPADQAVTLNGKMILRTSKNAPTAQTSMLKFDANTRTGSFLPSKTSKLGNYTVLTASIPANIVAGPATGITLFSDLNTHWARNDVNELASKLIIDGRSPNLFQPNQSITRSEFAVYIAKGLGLTPVVSSNSQFRDVSPASSSAAYINAAAKAGIITGNTDGTFQPGSPITREQMAIMMVRALSSTGYNVILGTTPSQTLRVFKDSKKITYQDFVAKAYQEGIIQGTSTTTFEPKGNATRAQAAVMLKRVLTKLGYL